MILNLHAGGTVRCINGVWSILHDSGHTPFNIKAVEQDWSKVIIIYPKITTSIVTSFATPDETYVKHKIDVGPSVGFDRTILQFGKTNAEWEGFLTPSAMDYPNSNVWFGVFCAKGCTTCIDD
jgi:hypothetical protein